MSRCLVHLIDAVRAFVRHQHARIAIELVPDLHWTGRTEPADREHDAMAWRTWRNGNRAMAGREGDEDQECLHRARMHDIGRLYTRKLEDTRERPVLAGPRLTIKVGARYVARRA